MAPFEAGQVNREGNENADMKCDPKPNARRHGGNRFTCVKGRNPKHQKHLQFSLARRNVFRRVNDREWMLSWKSLSNQEN